MNRPERDEYYLNIALEISRRGTCLRRNYGAVIVKTDQIISTGYTGVPRWVSHCKTCLRNEKNIPSGERYDLCRSIHAEQNAIIHSSRQDMLGSEIFVAGFEVQTGEEVQGKIPCEMCKRFIINAGIHRVTIKSKLNPLIISSIPVSCWIEDL